MHTKLIKLAYEILDRKGTTKGIYRSFTGDRIGVYFSEYNNILSIFYKDIMILQHDNVKGLIAFEEEDVATYEYEMNLALKEPKKKKKRKKEVENVY